MSDEVYTLGVWRIKEGKETEFVEAWKALSSFFRGLPRPPGTGTLVQSTDEPSLFYSFGPWQTLADVEAMRSHPNTRDELARLTDLCEEAHPGTFRVIATG
ncbi:MAG: hypothetical protein WB245_09820 [Acidimicrobiia bacterium]